VLQAARALDTSFELTPKHSRVLKGLLRSITVLGDALYTDSSDTFILQVLEQLERWLSQAKEISSTRAAYIGSVDGVEVAALLAGIDQLFELSSELSGAALHQQAQALVSVATVGRAAALAAAGGARGLQDHSSGVVSRSSLPFGERRLLDVCRANLRRLPVLWGVVTAHLTSTPAEADGTAAVVLLARDSLLALHEVRGHLSMELCGPHVAIFPAVLRSSNGLLALHEGTDCALSECELLAPLLEASGEVNAAAVLAGVSEIVAECGPSLGAGWRSILSFLAACPARAAAWSCMQRIIADFLSELDASLLQQAIETEAR